MNGLVFFQARADLFGIAFNVGHLMFDFSLPSFRYAITSVDTSTGTDTLHLFTWHTGLDISYVF